MHNAWQHLCQNRLSIKPPRAALVRLLAVLLVGLTTTCAVAQPAAVTEPSPIARLITLRLPFEGEDVRRAQAVVQRAVDQMTSGRRDERPTLVIEFSPRAATEGRGVLFEDAVKLARFLQSEQVAAVKTIAYLPATIKGHAVLIALACNEIAIAPDAELGNAGADEAPDRPVEPGIVSLYEQVATARGTVPATVAAALIDARREVLRVETEDSIRFVPRDELETLRADRTIVDQDLLTPTGSMAVFSGRRSRELGFARYLVPSRDALARSLQVPLASLEEDLSLLADWQPVMIDIEGPITPRVAQRVATLIGGQIDKSQVNWIGLRIDSTGGDLESCLQLAVAVAELARREVQTVAYVPTEAAGEAALVALACDRLVMQPGAHLGTPLINNPAAIPPIAQPANDEPADNARKLPLPAANPPANQQPPVADREAIDSAVASIRASLEDVSDQPWSLLAAMIDPDLEIYRYTNRDSGERRLMGEAEADGLPDAPRWRRREAITQPGVPLRLDAEQAAELGVAWRVVDKFDDLTRLYGFADEVPVAALSWADELVEILASDQMAIVLLMAGFVGVYLELNSPGLGIGGLIATVAFVLFFWSKFTAQTADWLEVMLFLTGLVFLLIEVFVLPGFGVFGLGGLGLVVTSLILASQTFLLPKTESQIAELRGSIGVVIASMAAFLIAAMVLRRYLPHAPWMRRMLLSPPEAEELIEIEQRESIADFAHLVGRTGIAATNLLPSGRVEVDGELIDVVSQDVSIDRGEVIVVVEAHGSRVVVRKA